MGRSDDINPLVGTWKLVSFQVETEGSGERKPWWDEHPMGIVIFTGDGRMLAFLTAGNRAASATADELFGSLIGYSGRYRVENDRLITKVDGAWLPAWVGTEVPRTFTRNGDDLSLMSDFHDNPRYPGRRVRGVLMWRKE